MEVAKLVLVFGLAMVELWAAVPAGLALQLHPIVTAILTSAGTISGLLVVIILGERARAWLLRKHGGDEGRQHRWIRRIWIPHGVIGLGLLAPLLTGAPLGAGLGMVLGAPMGRLLLWMSIGVVTWSLILSLAGALGLAGITSFDH